MDISGAQTAILFGVIANFVALITLGWKVSRFMSHMEFKVDLMWTDYSERNKRRASRRQRMFGVADDHLAEPEGE